MSIDEAMLQIKGSVHSVHSESDEASIDPVVKEAAAITVEDLLAQAAAKVVGQQYERVQPTEETPSAALVEKQSSHTEGAMKVAVVSTSSVRSDETKSGRHDETVSTQAVADVTAVHATTTATTTVAAVHAVERYPLDIVRVMPRDGVSFDSSLSSSGAVGVEHIDGYIEDDNTSSIILVDEDKLPTTTETAVVAAVPLTDTPGAEAVSVTPVVDAEVMSIDEAMLQIKGSVHSVHSESDEASIDPVVKEAAAISVEDLLAQAAAKVVGQQYERVQPTEETPSAALVEKQSSHTEGAMKVAVVSTSSVRSDETKSGRRDETVSTQAVADVTAVHATTTVTTTVAAVHAVERDPLDIVRVMPRDGVSFDSSLSSSGAVGVEHIDGYIEDDNTSSIILVDEDKLPTTTETAVVAAVPVTPVVDAEVMSIDEAMLQIKGSVHSVHSESDEASIDPVVKEAAAISVEDLLAQAAAKVVGQQYERVQPTEETPSAALVEKQSSHTEGAMKVAVVSTSSVRSDETKSGRRDETVSTQAVADVTAVHATTTVTTTVAAVHAVERDPLDIVRVMPRDGVSFDSSLSSSGAVGVEHIDGYIEDGGTSDMILRDEYRMRVRIADIAHTRYDKELSHRDGRIRFDSRLDTTRTYDSTRT
eukprot:Lankesteria_metandrocarpae@DN5439_c0_g1_i7.p1